MNIIYRTGFLKRQKNRIGFVGSNRSRGGCPPPHKPYSKNGRGGPRDLARGNGDGRNHRGLFFFFLFFRFLASSKLFKRTQNSVGPTRRSRVIEYRYSPPVYRVSHRPVPRESARPTAVETRRDASFRSRPDFPRDGISPHIIVRVLILFIRIRTIIHNTPIIYYYTCIPHMPVRGTHEIFILSYGFVHVRAHTAELCTDSRRPRRGKK